MLSGCLVCVIWSSNSIHSFISKLCIIIVHILKMCSSYFMHISYSFRFSTGVELRDITHISLRACMFCMYWYGILEGTRAWCYNYRDGEGDTAPENFGIYSFIEQDQSTFFTSEEVKCSCSEQNICILSSFWHKTEEILFWVRFGYCFHLKAIGLPGLHV